MEALTVAGFIFVRTSKLVLPPLEGTYIVGPQSTAKESSVLGAQECALQYSASRDCRSFLNRARYLRRLRPERLEARAHVQGQYCTNHWFVQVSLQGD